MFAFSHRWPSIQVPKEHENLHRLLRLIHENEQIDFLNRFVEYLARVPKYVNDKTSSFPSDGEGMPREYKQEYLSSLDAHKGMAALFSAFKMAARDLENIMLQLNDTLSEEKLDLAIKIKPKSGDSLKGLKGHVWKGEKAKASAVLRQYLKEEGVT